MKKTMSWFGLAVRATLLLVAFFLLNGWVTGHTARLEETESQLRVTLSEQRDANLELQSEISEVGSDYYIESKARAEYQFVKPGELSFSFTNPEELYQDSEEERSIRQSLN